jgi:hypothetical protein
MAGSRIGDEEVRCRWRATNNALEWNTLIGAGEWVRCKARGSVGPETYVAGYFEDHARPRIPPSAGQIAALNGMLLSAVKSVSDTRLD